MSMMQREWKQVAAAAEEPIGPPGTDGLWTFVFMDMMIFLMMFVMFMAERRAHGEMYAASQLRLNELFGLVNTLILLTSSWKVVEATRASRAGQGPAVSRHLGQAILLGALFVISKLVEYRTEIAGGATPVTNSFFSFYFFITFVHLLHVLAGLVCIAYCRSHSLARAGTGSFQTGLENVGLFWHFVDVLWIYIFPMLYLLGRT